MTTRIHYFAIGVIFSYVFNPISGYASSPPDLSLVEGVVSHLEGVMDTSAQAAADPQKANVRMTTCKVKVGQSNSNSIYLYQEQALTESLDSPYRQRFLEITPSDHENEVISRTYKPVNSEIWQGFCDLPLTQRIVPQENINTAICDVYLKPLINIYIGNTQPEGCPSNFRGATKITNKIILHDQGMDTWDRGFDSTGELVWGAEDEGYQYRWFINKN